MNLVERLNLFVMALALVVVLVGVLLQVFFRYVLACPLAWSQELVQYFFIWMVYLAAGLGVRQGIHLRVDLLRGRLPESWRWIQSVFVNLVCMVLAGTFLVAGAIVAWLTRFHTSPAMGLHMGLVYIIFPLSGLLLAVFLAEAIALAIKNKNPAKSTNEES